MPFKLKISEDIVDGIQRMGLEQIQLAKKELNNSIELSRGIHEARKCFKRLRALLHLINPAISPKVYRREVKCFQQIARQISVPRDYQAQMDMVKKLSRTSETKIYFSLLKTLDSILLQHLKRENSELQIIAIDTINQQLNLAENRWRKLDLNRLDMTNLTHGFALTYDDGRENLKQVLQKNNSHHLHQWRKSVQRHWRQMQILMLIWPDHIMPRVRLAQEISQLIGADHDLWQLQQFCRAQTKQLGSKKALKPFHKHCKHMRSNLASHALERGKRLYAFETQAIEHSMMVIWQSRQALTPLPPLAQNIITTTNAQPQLSLVKKNKPR